MSEAAAAKPCRESDAKLNRGADTRRAIYQAVYYFNLFDHPVTVDELASFSGLGSNETGRTLADLEAMGLVARSGNYVLIPGRDWIRAKREKDEAFFLRHYKKIKRAAWILSHMPFVRGIFLTGRTSKGVLSESDDFDFLVVSASDRAWIAWILLFLFRRIISLNFRNANFKWFCCNYVLAEDHLALTDRDVFIAMELACAFPVFNRSLLERFLQANEWRLGYFHQRNNSLPADLTLRFRLGLVQWLVEIPCRLFWRGRVRGWVEDYYRRRWLRLGIVKDETDCRAKASGAYVKPDTGGRRKFIIERAERLDPQEHQSFLRTKTNLHRALRANSDAPHILLTHASLTPAASLDRGSRRETAPNSTHSTLDPRLAETKSEPPHFGCCSEPESSEFADPLATAKFLRECGYRVEFYDASKDQSVTEVFRCVKARLIPLVAIYTLEPNRGAACRMIELFLGVGAKVIVAGPDAVAHPDFYMGRAADVVITGEVKNAVLSLLEHIYKGSIALESITGIRY